MMRAAASAGIASAAILASPGCDRPQVPQVEEKGTELRRAAFRSFAARDRLLACEQARTQAAGELQRFETLKDFARRRGAAASQSLWRGENDWNAASRLSTVGPCRSEADLRSALVEFSAGLDGLYRGIMSYEE